MQTPISRTKNGVGMQSKKKKSEDATPCSTCETRYCDDTIPSNWTRSQKISEHTMSYIVVLFILQLSLFCSVHFECIEIVHVMNR